MGDNPLESSEKIKKLEKLFNGDLDLMLFYLSWVKNGLNSTAAYRELHPDVTTGSAEVLGSRALGKVKDTIGIQAVMSIYGLDINLYLTQLREGLEANKQIAGIVINGKVKEADEKTQSFVEVPDHATRKGYHDKLGKLLGLENINGTNVAVQVNFNEITGKQKSEYGI